MEVERRLVNLPPVLPMMNIFWPCADTAVYANHRARIVQTIHDRFKKILDPLLLHTHWRVSDPFYWVGTSVYDEVECYGFLVTRMDGNSTPMPTGHEWLIHILPVNSFLTGYTSYYVWGGSAAVADLFVQVDENASGGGTGYGTDPGVGVKYQRSSLCSLEIWGTESLAAFVVGDTVYDTGGLGRKGRVYWVDPGDAGHIKVHMQKGVRFRPGETVVDIVGAPTKQIVIPAFPTVGTPAADVGGDEIDVVGTTWDLGAGFSLDQVVYIAGSTTRYGVVSWINPNNVKHLIFRLQSGARLQSGETIGDHPTAPTIRLSGTTHQNSKIFDIGYKDRDNGLWDGKTYLLSVRKATLANFTAGEKVSTPSGAIGKFVGWEEEANIGRRLMQLEDVIGKFKKGELLTGASSGSTAVVKDHSLVPVSGATYTAGNKVYTPNGGYAGLYKTSAGFIVYGQGSQTIDSATVGGGGPVLGEEVEDATGNKTGRVVSISGTKIKVVYDNTPWVPSDYVYKRSDHAVYLGPTLELSDEMHGYGYFYHGETMLGGDVSSTVRGDSNNYYTNYMTPSKSPLSQLSDFMPYQDSTTIGKGLRLTMLRALTTDYTPGPTEAKNFPEARQAFVFDWDKPFLAVYEQQGSYVSIYHHSLYGEIIVPKEATDYYRSGVFYAALDAGAYAGPGTRSYYRLEAFHGLYNPGIRTTFSLYQNTNFNWTNARRSDGKRDWAEVVLANSNEVKGTLDPDIVKVLGHPSWETLRIFVDPVDENIVYIHPGGYESFPWIKDKPAFPSFELEDMEWLSIVRDVE